MTVALALVPEAVAFALIAGLSPLTGLYAAFMVCLITSIFGGRPGMISGATGAIAVVLVSLTKSHGVEYIFATVILAGIIQLIAGFLKLGKLIRLVPHPVIFGFVNGLAIVIFMSQLDIFKDSSGIWLTGSTLYMLLGLVLLTMLIIWGLPKITKAVPASLTAILVIFGLVTFLQLDTKTVGDIASIKGGFPPFHIPAVPFALETLKIIFSVCGNRCRSGAYRKFIDFKYSGRNYRNQRKCSHRNVGTRNSKRILRIFFGNGRLCHDWTKSD